MTRSNEGLGGRSRSVSWAAIPLVLAAVVAVLLVAPIIPSPTLPAGSGSAVPLAHTTLTSGSGTWAVQHDGFAITGISCSGSSSCFAVGNMGEGGAFTTMMGSAWSAPTLIAGTASLTGISCPGAESCFAVGKSSGSSPAPIVEQTTNAGAAWTQLSLPVPMTSMQSISCSTSTACVPLAVLNRSPGTRMWPW